MAKTAAREDVEFLGSFDGPESVRDDLLDTFEFHSPTQRIETETSEFSPVCPFSGLPDYAKLKIAYYPTL